MDKTYKAEYENEEIEVFSSDNDDDAIRLARNFEDENGSLWGLWEVDEEYTEVRAVF